VRFRSRLVVAITATTVVTLGGAFAAVSAAVNHTQERQLDNALLAEATEEAFEVSQLGGGKLAISDRPGPYANDVGPLTKYGAIYSLRDEVLAATPTFGPASCRVPPLDLIRHEPASPFDLWCVDEHLRGVLVPIPKHGDRLLLLAAPRTDLDGDAAFLARAILIALAVSVGWSLLVSIWIVRKLTRDHRQIASVARLVAAGDLSARVRSQTVDSEMAQLAGDIDTMIEHLATLMAAQERFVANAAHELQTPITALYTDLQQALRKPRDNDGYRASVQVALEDTQRLKRLVQELLSFFKASHQYRPHTLIPTRDLVEGAVRSVSRLGTERGVEVTTHDDGSSLVGHRDDLERMLRNLLENAIRYSPTGGQVTIQVMSTRDTVRISIDDEGHGISEEENERIFEPFYRSPRSRAMAPEGAGLGLAIAREIARAHRGDVLRSETPRKRGTEFVVSIPIDRAPVERSDAAPAILEP
jgi:two-component system OmpR family sensor kinase